MSEGKRELGWRGTSVCATDSFSPSFRPCCLVVHARPVLALARLKNAKITAVNSADYIKRDLKSIENETQIHRVKEPKRQERLFCNVPTANYRENNIIQSMIAHTDFQTGSIPDRTNTQRFYVTAVINAFVLHLQWFNRPSTVFMITFTICLFWDLKRKRRNTKPDITTFGNDSP